MVQYHVIKVASGRWMWAVVAGSLNEGFHAFHDSFVEFPDGEAASQDLVRHQTARKVGGRIVEEAGYLQYMLDLLVQAEPCCNGASIAGIHWHEPEQKSGRNWDVTHVNGAEDAAACYDALRFKIDHLRDRFHLQKPD